VTGENTSKDFTAAELALGVLPSEEHIAATLRLHADSDFAAAVAQWEVLLAPLALEMAPVEPSDDLLARIEAGIGRRELARSLGRTQRAHEGEWIVFAPGVNAKVLWQNEATKRQGILLHVEPGATYPEHDHDDDEEFYMLSGEIQFGDLVLYAGDYHIAPKGSHHGDGISRNGCRCIMVTGL
jgi:quercetin dioxygenase-like cupin family protein